MLCLSNALMWQQNVWSVRDPDHIDKLGLGLTHQDEQ